MKNINFIASLREQMREEEKYIKHLRENIKRLQKEIKAEGKFPPLRITVTERQKKPKGFIVKLCQK